MTECDYSILDRLVKIIRKNRIADPKESYVANLFNKGRTKMAQKVGEEAVELVIEAAKNDPKKTISESADLLFHLLVLWEEMGVSLQDVLQVLEKREGLSGIEEKAKR